MRCLISQKWVNVHMTIFESKDTYAQFQAKLSVDKSISNKSQIAEI